MRAAKPCPTHGCPQLTPCPNHTPKPWADSNRHKELPGNWQTLRQRVLTRDHHTCQHCYGHHCGNRRLEVDHIIPGNDHRMNNLQTLGHDCHQAKTLAEAAAARRHQPQTQQGVGYHRDTPKMNDR